MAEDWHRGNQDSSFLLRGSRLEHFATWASETGLAITDAEHRFLEFERRPG